MSKKISALTAASAVASTDLLVIVDVSDTSQAATGSTRKVTVAEVVALANSTATPPGGSDNQVQYNNGGVFGGNAGLTINETSSRPVMANGLELTDAGNTMVLDGAPTASRTITFPDATDTLVGKATTDTLTNKTIDTADNTLKSTSQASGDILVNDGTKYTRLAKGANGTFLGVSAGAVGWGTPSAGGTPGGSDTQVQYNSSGSFAGASGLVYDGTNNQPQAPNGYVITNAGIRMVLAGFPTSSTKTITFPDQTGTVVLLSTVDTLTNKTINATNNTITDTSTAAGDLLKSNGTKFVRFARGSASQLLRVNAGGTDIEWATYTILAVAGSTSEIQVNSGSSTLAAATNVTAGSGYIAIGASSGSTGSLRFPLGSSSVLIGGKAGAGTNDQIIGSSGFHLYFGEVTPSNWSSHLAGDPVDIWSKSTFVLYYGASGTTGFTLSTAPNASFFGTGSFGARTKTIHLADGTEDCTHTPTGGGLLYSLGGAGKWIGTSGTNTTFAAADPHCDKCGRDFAHEWFNDLHDEYLMVCMPCMLGALESLGININAFSRRQLHP